MVDRCPVCDNWMNEPELKDYPRLRADPICRVCGWDEQMNHKETMDLTVKWYKKIGAID
jgi:hypothetical protein